MLAECTVIPSLAWRAREGERYMANKHQPETRRQTYKELFLVASGGLRLAVAGCSWLAQAHHQEQCPQQAPPPRQPTGRGPWGPRPCSPTLPYTAVHRYLTVPFGTLYIILGTVEAEPRLYGRWSTSLAGQRPTYRSCRATGTVPVPYAFSCTFRAHTLVHPPYVVVYLRTSGLSAIID